MPAPPAIAFARRTAFATLLALTLAPLAYAAGPNESGKSRAKAAPKRSQAIKIRQEKSGSQESSAERDRRLKRECKGLPNAGACLGYAGR